MISFETRFLKPFVIVFIFILRWPGAAACPTKIKENMSRAFFTRTFGVLARRGKQRAPPQTPGTDFFLHPMLVSCSHSSLTRKQGGSPPEWLKTATDSLDVKSFQGLLSPRSEYLSSAGCFAAGSLILLSRAKGRSFFLQRRWKPHSLRGFTRFQFSNGEPGSKEGTQGKVFLAVNRLMAHSFVFIVSPLNFPYSESNP